MRFIVGEDAASHPVHVGFFGAVGIVFEADGVADLVKQFFLALVSLFPSA